MKVWSVVHYDGCEEDIINIRSFICRHRAIEFLEKKIPEIKQELIESDNTVESVDRIREDEYHILYAGHLCDIIKIMESEVYE